MLKDIKTAKATIELYDFSLTIEGGALDTWSDWTVTSQNSIKLFGAYATSKSWTAHEHFSDEEEIEKYLWDELLSILQKYNHCSVEVTEEQVEICDECDERKEECDC